MARSKYRHPARIQTLLFDRALFTEKAAKDWAHRHGFRYGDVDVTDNWIRLRQFPPERCAAGTFGQREIRQGVRAVFCGAKNPPPLLLFENPKEDMMRLQVHNPTHQRGATSSRELPVIVVDRSTNPRFRRRHHRRRRNPTIGPRRRNPRLHRRRRNPLLPPVTEWVELATDGAGAVVGGFFASKISEMFLKEMEGNRFVAAAKRLAIGFLGMTLLRPFGRFARMFAVGAAVSALQPIIVPYIQIGPFAPQPAPPTEKGTSGIYPVEQTVLPGLSGIYPADAINMTEPTSF